MQAPLPANEAARLAALRSLGILDTPPDERFERITRVAQRIFGVPIALIGFMDADRQWFKSRRGLAASETPRRVSFCAHALHETGPLVVPDTTRDPRFAGNPWVTGPPHARSYAGHPLRSPGGHTLGTLCVIDTVPRTLSADDLALLADLAAWCECELTTGELSRAHAARREGEARLHIATDITGRARIEGELRAALAALEAQYRAAERARGETRAVIDAAGEGMALVAPDRRFLLVNRRFAALFDLSIDTLVGRRFEEFAPLVERVFADPVAFQRLVAGTASDTAREFTALVAQRWPQERDLQLYSTPVRDEQGGFLGRLYVFRDITREREVDRMKTDFISRVSHELRTPLTSIKGFVDILLDDEVGTVAGEQREFLEIVSNNTNRLILLINDLLDVSRIDSGRLALKRAAADLATLARGVVASHRPAIEAQGQRLALDIPPDLPAVDGDADRLRQILGNLLANARNRTPPGGAIRVAAAREGAVVRIAVGDSGPGLTPDEQDGVFDTLFQPHNRATQGSIGTGLGLAIVRSLVAMHGGEITLASAPGAGSTFSFTLPIATPGTAHDDEEDAE